MITGGTAFDYSEHVFSTINYIAELYSNFYKLSYDEVRDTMIDHIKSTMTDRATVNQATITLINRAWKKQLNLLYCHLHPLDTIATDIKKCLATMEEKVDTRQLSSSGCVAEKVLAAFDRLR